LELQSDLWLDQPDAHARIDERLAQGRLPAADASALHTIVDAGWLTLSLDLDAGFFDEFDSEVAKLWKKRPKDLAVSPPGDAGGRTSFRDYDGPIRETGYRIPDLHSHSKRALDLYLDPALFRMVELIFDQPAVAFQSLYFEHGSQQALHRDPMFVGANPASHLLASWVALEDVTTESGPLSYVPGSHRLPWFEFTPGSVVCGSEVSAAQRAEFATATENAIRERGLEVQPFTCRRGDAFIWHAGLLHGGTRIEDQTRTRKSFVTHYSTAAHYRSRTARMRVRNGTTWRRVKSTTERVIEREQQRGLDNPTRNSRR
jgi:phytanoyl-CoA hydroxylase